MASHIPTPTPNTLNILCFGDSLTEGYSEYGTKMTPYGTTTLAYLTSRLGPLTKVHLCVEGKSGDLVTAGFSRRMERICQSSSSVGGHGSLHEKATQWDWLVFLGGTNDLGYGRSVESIWETILSVTSIPMARGAKVLLLTVPECSAKNSQLDKEEEGTEGMIGRAYILDLYKKMPYHSLGEEEREKIWDDGLHFTEAGYAKIGEIAGRRLLGIIAGGEGRVDID